MLQFNTLTSIHTDLDGSEYEYETLASCAKREPLNHCDRQSFYGKAEKIEYINDKNEHCFALFSYGILICVYNCEKDLLHTSKRYWNFNATTRRHQIAFLEDLEHYLNPYEIYDRLTA